MGAAMNGVLVMIGGELGLWKAMEGAGPADRAEIAERSGVRERYVREWASAQAASGYLEYDSGHGHLHAAARAGDGVRRRGQPGVPARRLPRGQLGVQGPREDRRAIPDGDGFGWHEHDPELFLGTEQFFRPGYRAHLVAEWIPALEGIEEKLRPGAKVADIGCGHGISTILMAQAYPESTIPRLRLPRRLDRAGEASSPRPRA